MLSRAVLSVFVVLFVFPATLGADLSRKERRVLLRKLERGGFDSNTSQLLHAFEVVLERDDARSVRVAVKAYSRFVKKKEDTWTPGAFVSFHDKAAKAFSAVTSETATAEFFKLLKSNRDWHGRLLLLDASGFAESVGRLEGSLAALADEHPVVLRHALRYLADSREVSVVEAIVERYLEVSKEREGVRKKRGKAALRAESQWQRTELAFQFTLNRILKVELQAAQDFKNYFSTRKKAPDIFSSSRKDKRKDATQVTLFGTAVTGKNIAIVLDVSGSMLAIDLSSGRRRKSGRTTSKPSEENLVHKEGQRLYRAKQELVSVVRSLMPGVRFTLMTFASEVDVWKESVVPASDENKKSAISYVRGLEADGVTVTDLALEAAFSNPDLDTIYLITDGAPTYIGGSSSEVPADTRRLIEKIHRRVRELNFLRGVRIFTLGFEGAEEVFLKKLSTDNSGTYARIE